MNEIANSIAQTRKFRLLPALIFLVLAIIFVHPIFKSWSKLGIHDWSLFYISCGFERRALLQFHQPPLWNPYTFGGTPHWGHTHQMVISPFFLPVLIRGEVIGLKIAFILYLWAGMGGMWLLSRRMGMKKISSYFATIIWGLNGYVALRFVVGHINHLPLLLLPWVILFFLKACRGFTELPGSPIKTGRDGTPRVEVEPHGRGWNPAPTIWAGAVLALMFLSGGDYAFIFSLIFLVTFAIFLAVRRPLRVFGALILTLVAAFAFSAVKLIPTIEFLRQSVPIHPERSGVDFAAVLKGLLTRNLSLQVDYTKAGYGQWEYGAYIGIVPIIFYLAGAFLAAKRFFYGFILKMKAGVRGIKESAWPPIPALYFYSLLWLGLLFLFMSTGFKGPFPIFIASAWVPFLKNLHVPFRFISLFIFTAALLSGYFLSFIERRSAKMRLLAAALSIFLVIDFVLLARPVFKEAFVVAERRFGKRAAVLELPEDTRLWNRDLYGLQLAEAPWPGNLPIEHIRLNWLKKNPHFPRDAYWLIQPETLNAYLNLLQRKGTLDFYDPQHLEPFALAKGDADYHGEVFLASDSDQAEIVKFTPNRIEIQFQTDTSNTLVINQNHFSGWSVKGDVRGKVRPFNGLISVDVGRGEGKALFQFLPASFFIGLCVSLIALGISCYIGFLRWLTCKEKNNPAYGGQAPGRLWRQGCQERKEKNERKKRIN